MSPHSFAVPVPRRRAVLDSVPAGHVPRARIFLKTEGLSPRGVFREGTRDWWGRASIVSEACGKAFRLRARLDGKEFRREKSKSDSQAGTPVSESE